MKSGTLKFKNEPIDLGDVTYYVNGEARFIVDKNYGADADGNRGHTATWFELDDVEILDENKKEVMVYKEQAAVLDYIENNWENFTWSFL